jgi:hypothetical protein
MLQPSERPARGEHDDLPTRRDLIRLLAVIATAPSAARFLTAWLEAAPHSGHTLQGFGTTAPAVLRNYRPRFFDAEDFGALLAFTDILIPADDTPGARDAHCAEFIDFVLAASTDVAQQMQRQWREAMRTLRDAGFHSADAAGRARLVDAISRPERERGATHPAYFAYRLIKQQNTFAFYTSREGIIQALDYKGNSYNATFPACEHPDHRVV